MLGIVKSTQGNKTKEVWSKVPLLDFTSNSSIDWNLSVSEIDLQLYNKYSLTQDERNFIKKSCRYGIDIVCYFNFIALYNIRSIKIIEMTVVFF